MCCFNLFTALLCSKVNPASHGASSDMVNKKP